MGITPCTLERQLYRTLRITELELSSMDVGSSVSGGGMNVGYAMDLPASDVRTCGGFADSAALTVAVSEVKVSWNDSSPLYASSR